MRSFWVAAALTVFGTTPALATGCFPIAQANPSIQVASLDDDAFFELVNWSGEPTVEISFLGHSSFLIEAADGTRAVTDYNGMQLSQPPHVATMNNAHSTHFTPFPDPEIKHVLQGWGENNAMAQHDIEVGDLRVRNIPTSVHGRTGGQTNSNSIFVYEVRDLCIAHLGHLHHVLEDVHLAEMGIIDIVMVPIDGVWTMSQVEMARVVEQIDPAVVLPMHYFGSDMVTRFAALLGEGWDLEISAEPTVAFSRELLPSRQILVMPITRG